VVLDAIVTVVDARNIEAQLARGDAEGGTGTHAVNEAQRQVAYADIILLNKTDLVNAAALPALHATLKRHNESTQVVPCERCQVDLAAVLNRRCYQDGMAGLEGVALEGEGVACPAAACQDDACHTHSKVPPRPALHDPGVTSVALRVAQDLPLAGLRRWMDSVLWERAAVTDIFRIKGLVAVAGSPNKHILQVCGGMSWVLTRPGLSGLRGSAKDEEIGAQPLHSVRGPCSA